MSRGPIPDKPADRPTVPEVTELLRAFVSKPDNELSGGVLHIAIADGNLDDSDLTYCLERAREQGDTDAEQIALSLLSMTRTQRARIYHDRSWWT